MHTSWIHVTCGTSSCRSCVFPLTRIRHHSSAKLGTILLYSSLLSNFCATDGDFMFLPAQSVTQPHRTALCHVSCIHMCSRSQGRVRSFAVGHACLQRCYTLYYTICRIFLLLATFWSERLQTALKHTHTYLVQPRALSVAAVYTYPLLLALGTTRSQYFAPFLFNCEV